VVGESLSVKGGMQMDVAQAAALFGPYERMNLGWRDAVRDDARGLLMVRIGSSRVVRKLIIRLNALDLYDIEIGRMNKRTFEWVVEGQVENLYAEQVAEQAIVLHGKVAG
jgi:hypothetical protein